MATSILRRSYYQKLQKFYVVLNSSQNTSFLRRDLVTPVCSSLRFCSNTPSDNSGTQTGNSNAVDSQKTVLLPAKSAQYLSEKINQIAEKTGTSLKLNEEKGGKGKIPLYITATSPEDILKAVTEINEVLQNHLAEARLAQPLEKRLEELIYLPRRKAEFLMKNNNSVLLDLQNETGTQIKVLSDERDEQVLLMLTATEQDAVNEVLNKIQSLVSQRKIYKEKLTVNHPKVFLMLNELKDLRKQTGARINFQKQEDGGVFTISDPNQSIVEKAKAMIEERLDNLQHKTFTFKTEGRRPWKMLVGVNGSNIKQLRSMVKEVDPSLLLTLESSEKDDQLEILSLAAMQQIDDEKFEAAATLISQHMAKIDERVQFEDDSKGKKMRQGFKRKMFTFKTEGRRPWKMLIGVNGSNISELSSMVKEVDPSLFLKLESSEKDNQYDTLYLRAMKQIDDGKFEAAATLVSQHMAKIDERFEDDFKDKKMLLLEENIKVSTPCFYRIKSHLRQVEKETETLIDSYKDDSVLKIQGRSTENIEEAKAKIEEIGRKHNSRTFTIKTDSPKFFHILIGKSTANIQKLQKILHSVDPSLAIGTSVADKVIHLWGSAEMDHAKFEEAESIVTKRIEEIDHYLETLKEKAADGSILKTFSFQNTSVTEQERLFSLLIGSNGDAVTMLRESLLQVDPAFHLKIKADENVIQLKGPQHLDPAKVEKAESIITQRIEELESYLEMLKENKQAANEDVLRTFCFETRSVTKQDGLFSLLIGIKGEAINKLRESLLQVDPAFHLKIKSDENVIQLKGPELLVDPTKVEEAEHLIRERLAVVERLVKTEKIEREDRSGMKSFNFEVISPIAVSRMIGKGRKTVESLKEALRSMDPTFDLSINYKENTVSLYASEDMDEDKFMMGKSFIAKEMAAFEKSVPEANMRERIFEVEEKETGRFIGKRGLNVLRIQERMNQIDKAYKLKILAAPDTPTGHIISLKAGEKNVDALEAIVQEELDAVRETADNFLSPIKRSDMEQSAETLGRTLDTSVPLTKQYNQKILKYSQDLVLTRRMITLLANQTDDILKKLQVVANEEGKLVNFTLSHKQLLISADTEEDLDEFCKEVEMALSRHRKRYTTAIKITDSIWVQLLKGMKDDLESEYGVKLYTYQWSSTDRDCLEIEYINREDFNAVTKAINELHKPNLKLREVTLRPGEVHELMNLKGKLLQEIEAKTNTIMKMDLHPTGQHVLRIFADSDQDIDAAVKNVKAIATKDSVKPVTGGLQRRPSEPTRTYEEERRELVNLVREALNNREIIDTQDIDLPEDFSFSKIKPLNIWTKEDLKKPEPQDPTDNLWYQLDMQGKEIEKRNKTTFNGFEDMIHLTKQGKLWHYPINNEQGMEEEQAVSFTDHVFFDDLLEDFPSSGPIRTFMEQVTVGLSQNPNLSVEEKREHIEWYKTYFQQKAEALKDTLGENVELKTLFSTETSKQKET